MKEIQDHNENYDYKKPYSKISSPVTTQNFGDEFATAYSTLSSNNWPLKKLSASYIPLANNKGGYKTSIDLFNKKLLKESSLKLFSKSELYIEKLVINEYDSELDDSELSTTSIDDPIKNPKAKVKLDELINKYYMGSNENKQGNYDSYVTNCLKLITYFKHYNYFENKIKLISNDIKEEHDSLKLDQTKKLLVLDLDETIIHCDLNLKWSMHDQYISMNDETVIPINIRPFLFDFLNFCIEFFDIIIYTASCKDYADTILDYIEKDKKYFKYRFYREHCYTFDSFFFKDLSIFNYPLSKIVLVDNNLFSFPHYLNNSILVTSFYNDSDDLDLCSLIEFFESSIINCKDVRVVLNSTFEFEKIYNDMKAVK